MTHAEAIAAIKANWPTENYTMLREALTLACAALASPPAEDENRAKLAEVIRDVAQRLESCGVMGRDLHLRTCSGDEDTPCNCGADDPAEVLRGVADALIWPTAAQAPPASDPPWSAEATLKSLEIGFCSSNCGPVYRADEDGCCVTCGGDITFHDRSWPLGQTRCTVCQDTALPCQLGHTGRMLGSRSAAQAPPGLVDLMARWQRAERAWQQAQDETGQVYEPEGLWEERHELFQAMLAYPLPASPQAETKGDA